MEERIKKILEPTEYLRENFKPFIEAFVAYYGEEYREIIESKFNHIYIVAYQKNFDLEKRLKDLESELGKEKTKERFQKYYEYLDTNKNTFYQLHRKYSKEYAKKLLPYLPEKYHRIIHKFIDSDDTLFFFSLRNQCPELNNLIGQFDNTSIFEYFSPEADQKLNDAEVDDFEKHAILRKRIEYFNMLGINNGDDYSQYASLEGYYPSPEMVHEILSIKKDINRRFRMDYVSFSYPNFLFRKKEKELGLMADSRRIYILMELLNENNCVMPNLRFYNGTLDLYPEMFIYTGSDSSIRDEIIIHELNHIFEMEVIGICENHVVVRSGWDSCKIRAGDDQYSLNQKRTIGKYERFNEVINELIALEIFQKFSQLSGGVLGTPGIENNLHNSYLEHEYIVRDFFQAYKKEILESRRTGNMNILFDAVGRENFEALNDLVNEDFQTFSSPEDIMLYGNVKQSDDSDLAAKYYQILAKRDKIMKNIQLYNMNQQPNNEIEIQSSNQIVT